MRYLTLAIICATSLLSGTAGAKENRPITPEVFVQKAAVSNLFEIESSQLAIEKSSNAQLRQFAEQMIHDHENAAVAMKKAVKESKLDENLIPNKLDEYHQEKMSVLRARFGDEFDETYINMQEQAHDRAVRLFESYAEYEGQHPEIQKFAMDTLPVLRRHEQHTDELEDEIGSLWD